MHWMHLALFVFAALALLGVCEFALRWIPEGDEE